MPVARTERCRVAVDRSSAREVRNKAARRFGLDRGVDFERYELNVRFGSGESAPPQSPRCASCVAF
eukprot:2517343-Prymnesium_polylepis.1